MEVDKKTKRRNKMTHQNNSNLLNQILEVISTQNPEGLGPDDYYERSNESGKS
jgi:hypothetical protein